MKHRRVEEVATEPENIQNIVPEVNIVPVGEVAVAGPSSRKGKNPKQIFLWDVKK